MALLSVIRRWHYRDHLSIREIVRRTGLSRKQVATVFDEISNYIKQEIGKKGPGIFTLPGLLKVKRVEKPATKPRQREPSRARYVPANRRIG